MPVAGELVERKHFFICHNIDGLNILEKYMKNRGVLQSQILVLSKDDAGVEKRERLYNFESMLKYAIVLGTMLSALAVVALVIVTLLI